MLSGLRTTLKIFAPTMSNQLTVPVTKTISDDVVEFANTADYDIPRDGYFTAKAQIDIGDSSLRYKLWENINFPQPSANGFNGYVLTFAGLGAGKAASIQAVDLVKGLSTISLQSAGVSFTDRTLSVDVGGLRVLAGDELVLRIGFKVVGTARADWLQGGDGRDLLAGGTGDDHILGGGGRDQLQGGKGRDFLDGGSGADLLYGGAGADIFVLRTGTGADRIMDFQDGADRILIRGFANSFRDLDLDDTAAGTRIRITGNTFALVEGISADQLTAADFLF